ncbi:hypothetical protein ACFWGN_16170 [Oerskovia sp. NPDC060338]|uniref:hypothetical protein n=1 Tax=Oerskovia sp. NPDC060338 TaxID=3347100 RepID=UPI0036594A6B
MATDPAWPITGAMVAADMSWPPSRVGELEQYVAAAVSKIEVKVGPWHGQELTHTVTAVTVRPAIVLPWPCASIDSVTVDGAPLTPLTADPEASLVYGPLGPGRIVVTATARPPGTVPPEVILAGQRLAAFLAGPTKLGPKRPGAAGSNERDVDVLAGFALPRQVSELIKDYVLPGAFA